MAQAEAQMFKRYHFKTFEVRVIQKWEDPFGKRMIRFADVSDSERAMGLGEDEFMSEAKLSATQDEALPE